MQYNKCICIYKLFFKVYEVQYLNNTKAIVIHCAHTKLRKLFFKYFGHVAIVLIYVYLL